MKEAIQFWKDKKILPPDEFYGLSLEKRVTAFTVSKLATADMIQDVYNALAKAISEGMSLNEFKKKFEYTRLPKWRLETVFRTNIQTAFQVGRYRQMTELKRQMPYWMYDAVNDSRTRPTHAAMDGKVYPADHPFWKTWYPPNGYNCRCSVVPLSRRHVRMAGVKVEKEMPPPALPDGTPLYPDPGFHTNPGEDYWGKIESIVNQKKKKYFPALRKHVEKSLEDIFGEIRSFRDMEKIIRERLSDEFSRGFREIRLTSATYFMATDLDGKIFISQRGWRKPDGSMFYPYRSLKNAFKKLGKEPLSFDEEYAIESLWHEIVHNKQIRSLCDVYEKRFMELTTQWYSRRSYQKLLKKLGDFSPMHQEEIKAKGYGYKGYVEAFDRLVKEWNISEEALIQKIERIINEVPQSKYLDELSKAISEMTGMDFWKVFNTLSLLVS